MIINAIGGLYWHLRPVLSSIFWIIGILTAYRFAYLMIGVFWTRKFKHTQNYHKYAILIPARNEEKVIGNLLDSISRQDYPADLITVFVVADNCTDNTALISRDKEAVVYERFDEKNRTKGYALQFLFENIRRDYGIDAFEGYFIFDADNLLKVDYISRMNDAFDSGVKIITSYRNTKNFDDNWVSSIYALHWLRSVRARHRARSILRLSTNIQGTGFLFSNELVKDGWKWTSLTEDRAFTADAVAMGYEISYNDEAMFFDEQPTSLKISLRQRLRWSRGHILAFVQSGPKLFVNIFFGKHFIKNAYKSKAKQKSRFDRFTENIRHRFACFDTLMQLTPVNVLSVFGWLTVDFVFYSFALHKTGISGVSLFGGSGVAERIISHIYNPVVTKSPGLGAVLAGLGLAVWFRILYLAGSYVKNIFYGSFIFFLERKNIKSLTAKKIIISCLAWPVFDIIGRYTNCIAVFKHVSWKPIPHKSDVTIDQLDERASEKQKDLTYK
jgi:cellulose synthase/poly-beta-1,6-N-acetylglucosamine synthase-like glycosyltransferase